MQHSKLYILTLVYLLQVAIIPLATTHVRLIATRSSLAFFPQCVRVHVYFSWQMYAFYCIYIL